MVKKMLESICVCTVVIFFFVSSEVRANETKEWVLDPEFSTYLTIMSTNYRALTNSEISEEVDTIRIYRNYGRNWKFYDMKGILSQREIFESSNREVIREILLAAEQVEDITPRGCHENRSDETYYVVAFKNEGRKCGYFLLKLCRVGSVQIGIIRPFLKGDSSTIYYNKSLVSLLKEKGILERE